MHGEDLLRFEGWGVFDSLGYLYVLWIQDDAAAAAADDDTEY